MVITGWFTALLIGVLVGVAVRLVVSGQRRTPRAVAVGIGIAGAALGTLAAWVFGVVITPGGVDWLELLLQACFAAAGIAIGGYLIGRKGPP